MVQGAGKSEMDGVPVLTVVMPNYNDAAFLAEAIGAIRAQIESIGKLLFIDDGSKDDSIEVARRATEGWPGSEIRVNAVNRGVIPTINDALRDVKTPYVYFAASNDRVAPDFICRCLDLLRRHPEAGLCSALVRYLDDKNREGAIMRSPLPLTEPGYLPPEDALRALERLGNWIVGTATIYRTESLNQAGAFDPRLHGATDSTVAMILAVRHGSCFMPEVGAFWRQSAEGYARASILDWKTMAETVTIGYAKLVDTCPPGSRFPEMWKREQLLWHFHAALDRGHEPAAAANIDAALGSSPLRRRLLMAPLPHAARRILATAMIAPHKFRSAINRRIG